MADYGHVETMLWGLPDELKRILLQVFQYLLRDLRFGRAVAEERAYNFGGGFFAVTTPAVANTAFTIPHNLKRPPYLVIPVLDLTTTGAKLVRLTVTAPADAQRLYLSSPDTSAPVTLYVEG